MGWLARLLRTASKEELSGIRLEEPSWEIDGPVVFPHVFNALRGWLPDGAILYFEGGSPDAQIEDFIVAYAIPERVHIALGTL